MPDNQTLELVFIAIVALTMVVQTVVVLVILAKTGKALQAMRQNFEELRSTAVPVIANARDLLERITPKLTSATDDLAGITQKIRHQANDVQSTATEMTERLRRQAARLDEMMTAVLDAVERAGAFVTDAVSKPMRQLSGILASARAVVESMRTPVHEERREEHSASPPESAPADKDMFV